MYVPYNRETDLGRYTTYDISEIIVSKGYASPMYGANTLGGAVNIVTKSPPRSLKDKSERVRLVVMDMAEFMTLSTNQGNFLWDALSF